MQPRSIRERIAQGRDAKERGRLRVAAVVRELAGMGLKWVDPKTGWEFVLDSPPRAIASKRDGNRHGTAQELTVRKDGVVIFRDRVQCWDGSPVLVPDGTFDLQGNAHFREAPQEALRSDLAHTVHVVTKGGKRPWVKAKPGTVSTFYSGTGDGYIQSGLNATYAAARDGSGTIVTNDVNTTFIVGQRFVAAQYLCLQIFMAFDTSAIGTDAVTDAALSLGGNFDLSTTDFTVEITAVDWGGTLAAGDFVPGASLGAAIATFASAGFLDEAYNDFTEVGTGLTDAVNPSGTTYLIGASANQRTNTAPTDDERLIFYSADNTGTTLDPKLVVTHEAGVTLVDVAGNQPAASGEIAALSHIALAGAQPSAAGTIAAKTANKHLAGSQPAGAGALTLRRLLSHIALAGAQPAATGLVRSLQYESLAGNQPSASGTLAVKYLILVVGNQPNGTGTAVALFANKLLSGNQPNGAGALTVLTSVTVEGDQPAPSGDISILQNVSLAGAQPAPSGAITVVFVVKQVAGNQPSSTGTLVSLILNVGFAPHGGTAKLPILPGGRATTRHLGPGRARF